MAQHAAAAGAEAVVLSAPYYFPAGQPELLDYIEDIAHGTAAAGVFVQHAQPYEAELRAGNASPRDRDSEHRGAERQLAQIFIFTAARQLAASRPDFSLLVGPEELLGETVLLGGHGGVCGGANLFPRLYVELYEAASAAQLDRMASLHARVMQLGDTIYAVGKHRSAFIKGLKCALSCLGICDDFMAEPFQRFRTSQRELVQTYLTELGVSPAQRAVQLAE